LNRNFSTFFEQNKKNRIFRTFIYLELQLNQFSAKSGTKKFFTSLHSLHSLHFTTRTGAGGLGRFRIRYSKPFFLSLFSLAFFFSFLFFSFLFFFLLLFVFLSFFLSFFIFSFFSFLLFLFIFLRHPRHYYFTFFWHRESNWEQKVIQTPCEKGAFDFIFDAHVGFLKINPKV